MRMIETGIGEKAGGVHTYIAHKELPVCLLLETNTPIVHGLLQSTATVSQLFSFCLQ